MLNDVFNAQALFARLGFQDATPDVVDAVLETKAELFLIAGDLFDHNRIQRDVIEYVYEQLALRCTGMEFATEMLIRASLGDVRIGEVPITLHKDGRVAHGAHLRTFRDGWRTLRFFLMYSPRWLFMAPGMQHCAGGEGPILPPPDDRPVTVYVARPGLAICTTWSSDELERPYTTR